MKKHRELRFVISMLVAAIIFAAGLQVPADEGPLLTVTVAKAPLQITENGTSRTIAEVPVETRLWAFETNGEHYLVMDPRSKKKGWIWNQHAEEVTYADEENAKLTDSDEAMEQANQLREQGDLRAALRLYEKSLSFRKRIRGESDPFTALAQYSLANCHLDLEDYPTAIAGHRTALNVLQRFFGRDHWDTGYAFSDLGRAYHNSEDYTRAMPNYQAALEIFEKLAATDTDEDVLMALGNISLVYESTEEYLKAVPLRRRLLKLTEKLHGAEHADTATARHDLALCIYNLGQLKEAKVLLQETLVVRQKLLGDDHEDIAQTLNSLASIAYDQSDYERSEELYRKALEMTTRLVGEEHEDTALALESLGVALQGRGQYAKAEELYRRCLKIREALSSKPLRETASTLTSLGSVSANRGEFSQAEQYYQRAMEMYRSLGCEDSRDATFLMDSTGWMHELRGEYARAEPLFQRSLEIRTKLLGEKHLETATAMFSLGTLYGDLGEYSKAEELLKKALDVRVRLLGEDNRTTADSCLNLGWLYHNMGDLKNAHSFFERSHDINTKVLGRDHPDIAISLMNLANGYKEKQDYETAKDLLTESVALCRRTLGDHTQTGVALSSLGQLHLTLDEFDEAEKLILEGLALTRKFLDEHHPGVAGHYGSLATLYAAKNDFNNAIQYCEKSRRSTRSHMAKTLPGLSEQSQQQYLANGFRPGFTAALSLGLHQWDNPRAAVLSAGWLLNGKAVAQEVLAEAALLSSAESAPLVRELREVRDDISRLSIQADSPERRTALAARESRQQQLQVQLASHGLGLHKADPWISTGTLMSRIPFNAVMVNIARFEVCSVTELETPQQQAKNAQPARYVAWVIPAAGSGNIRIVDLGEAKVIDDQIAILREHIRGSLKKLSEDGEEKVETAFRESIADLSQAVLAPLEDSLADIEEVILSPDGELWNLPWNALLLSDGSFLVEKYRTRYVLSGRELIYEFQERSAASNPVIFADPDFDLNSDQVRDRNGDNNHQLRSASTAHFARLPASAAEAAAIRPSVEGFVGESARMLLQNDAQEATFKDLHRPRVLLLSTHGYFEKGPEAKESAAARPSASTVFDNPLLRCGLALAGCNSRGAAAESGTEDGILTGLEIVGTDLRGTELVVLSACETGLGDVRNGEGVAGLRQAFQLAGAKSVISSLWQVEDGETARLMAQFFRNLASGMEKSEALRQAQISRIHARRERFGAAHPFFWAAFTLTGVE